MARRADGRGGLGRWGAALAEHPLLLAALSAGFLALTLWLCASHGWRLGEPVGSGRRSAPLWVVAFFGLPLWTLGVAVGIWRAVVGPRRNSVPPPDDDAPESRA